MYGSGDGEWIIERSKDSGMNLWMNVHMDKKII